MRPELAVGDSCHFDMSISDGDCNWDEFPILSDYTDLTMEKTIPCVCKCYAISSAGDAQMEIEERYSSDALQVVIDTGADISVAPLWCRGSGVHCGNISAEIRNASGDIM